MGWVCVPMVVMGWVMESLSHLASRLATSSNKAKVTDLYGRLNLNLVRANTSAIPSR